MNLKTARILIIVGTAASYLYWLITPDADHYLPSVAAGLVAAMAIPNNPRVALACCAVCVWTMSVEFGVIG